MQTRILKNKIIKIFRKFGLSKDHATISAKALMLNWLAPMDMDFQDLICIVIGFRRK